METSQLSKCTPKYLQGLNEAIDPHLQTKCRHIYTRKKSRVFSLVLCTFWCLFETLLFLPANFSSLLK